ncbi:methyltransferase [Actinomadura rugatobispora]|uniref:Methyltransferase n=1 Tax=Actinomadura rugatobispora TaxID=1994 RepID=A0ABW0ZR02_9ACTN|nr:methyltransferase [Actinomadura rugatobispora]
MQESGPRNHGDGGMDAQGMIKRLIFGHMPARVIHVAARLGIADVLDGGPRTAEQLAAATSSDPASLKRLLRALTCFGVVVEQGPGVYTLGPMGGPLRSDAPGTLRELAMHIGGEALWQSWGGLEDSVRTGGNAFQKIFGTDYFEYLDRNPRPAATFNVAMGELTGDVTDRLVTGYDFSRFRAVVDVGGGNGTLIAAILRTAPGLRGVLFDTAQGVEQAAKTLADAGVADRCEVRAGDFFTSVPGDGDLYVLKSVVHDWDDERSEAILRRCAEAMSGDDRIVLIEPSQPAGGEPGEIVNTVMSDLNMMVLTGGHERSEAEIEALFDRAGIRLTGVTPIQAGTSHNIAEGALRS